MPFRSIALLLAAPLLLVACNDGSTDAAEAAETQGAVRLREATRVRVAPVERREMVAALETTTNLESERRVSIAPRIGGEVVAVLAEEGDELQVGSLLAKLDPRDAEVALQEARNAVAESAHAVDRAEVAIREAEARIEGSRLAFENAQAVYQRNEGGNLISAQDLDQLELNRDTARSDWERAKLALETAQIDAKSAATSHAKAELALERAELNLLFTELRAPFKGTVSKRSVRIGDQLSTGAEAFVLTDLDDLRAEFFRPQRELALFTGGVDDDGNPTRAALAVSIEAEALPGIKFDGEILRVSPDIDPASGSFRVTVDVEAVQHGVRLLPGMLVRMKVITQRHEDALVVSKRALRREGETSVIFVVRDDVAARIVVDELFSDDAFVEVRPHEGFELAAGEDVVIVGNRDLEDGDPVQVSRDDEPDAPASGDTDDAAELRESDAPQARNGSTDAAPDEPKNESTDDTPVEPVEPTVEPTDEATSEAADEPDATDDERQGA